MKNIWVLAQASGEPESFDVTAAPVGEEETTSTTVAADPNAPVQQRPARPAWIQWALPVMIVVVMYMMFFRGPRKKQQQHKQMVQSLEKNDKVRTIGGIIGTVVEVKDDEVILKVDESTNTKIRVAASAIGRNVSREKN